MNDQGLLSDQRTYRVIWPEGFYGTAGENWVHILDASGALVVVNGGVLWAPGVCKEGDQILIRSYG